MSLSLRFVGHFDFEGRRLVCLCVCVCYDVYGYDDHRNKLINSLILSNDSSKPTELTKGEQKLYLIYIPDYLQYIFELFVPYKISDYLPFIS